MNNDDDDDDDDTDISNNWMSIIELISFILDNYDVDWSTPIRLLFATSWIET